MPKVSKGAALSLICAGIGIGLLAAFIISFLQWFIYVDTDIELVINAKSCYVEYDGLTILLSVAGVGSNESLLSKVSGLCKPIESVDNDSYLYTLSVEAANEHSHLGANCTVSYDFWLAHTVDDHIYATGPRTGPIRCETLH